MRREDEGEQADAGLLLFQGGKEGGGDDATGDGEAHEGTDPPHHFNLELKISSISMKHTLKDQRKVLHRCQGCYFESKSATFHLRSFKNVP